MNKIKNIIQKIGKGKLEYEKEYFVFHQDRYQKILEIINEKKRNINILEIGCGYGDILRGCYEMNFKKLFGIDNCDLREDYLLRKKYTVNFKKCDLRKDKIPFEENNFDLIVFSEVLEHFNFYPLGVFIELKRVLKENGQLFLTTPNLSRLNNRVKLLLGKSINYDIRINSDRGAHYREYTAREIDYLLKEAGFEDIEIFYKHFSYPDVNFFVNVLNRIAGFFIPSLRSNLVILAT